MYFGGLDAECYRLREEGFSVRQIGRKLGIAGSSVQRCLARVEARRARTGVKESNDAFVSPPVDPQR
jgi:IS30 family transposase